MYPYISTFVIFQYIVFFSSLFLAYFSSCPFSLFSIIMFIFVVKSGPLVGGCVAYRCKVMPSGADRAL